MDPSAVTEKDIEAAIARSGYPFELEVASAFLAAGWSVSPSYQFYSPVRDREVEIDIVAIRTSEFSNERLSISAALKLLVECKANAFPYVLFGLPAPACKPDVFDPDYRYCHVDSTNDRGMPSGLALVAFDKRGENDVKAKHHHFASSERFHTARAVEPHNKELKLGVSERLGTALAGLGEALDIQHEGWLKAVDTVRTLRKDSPHHIVVTFPLLVHKGRHLRVVGADGHPVEAKHTPLFTSRESSRGSTAFVVDFVAFEALSIALASIEQSFNVLVGHLGRYLD